jgi:L,D-transpeptidase catalytic domain
MRPLRSLIALSFVVAAAAFAPAAHAASLTAGTGSTYPFSGNRAVFAGNAWHVVGTAAEATSGNVIVRLYRGNRVVDTSRPKIGDNGRYKARFRLGKTGPVTVEVVKPGGGGASALRARKFTVFVLDKGSRGGLTMKFIQRRLLDMGFWATQSGGYDLRTRWAVMAYRKVNRMARNFGLTSRMIDRIARGQGRFKPRFGATGRKRVEANLSLQVYVLIDAKGKVYRVVPTSTGKPGFRSDLGRFRFYRRQPGVNGLGMVNSVYYNGGEALHGYVSVPPFPASHGCLRTPTTYSRAIYEWVDLGDRMDVYGNQGGFPR